MQMAQAFSKGYLECCDDTELDGEICCLWISKAKASTIRNTVKRNRKLANVRTVELLLSRTFNLWKMQEWLPLRVSLSNPSDIRTWWMPFGIWDYETSYPNFKAWGKWQSSKHKMTLDWATGHREQIRIACLWQTMSTVLFKTHTGIDALCC